MFLLILILVSNTPCLSWTDVSLSKAAPAAEMISTSLPSAGLGHRETGYYSSALQMSQSVESWGYIIAAEFKMPSPVGSTVDNNFIEFCLMRQLQISQNEKDKEKAGINRFMLVFSFPLSRNRLISGTWYHVFGSDVILVEWALVSGTERETAIFHLCS